MAGDESQAFAAELAARYRVDREIGRGGWGLVFAAHDLRDDRQVAIKLLRGEFADSVSSARFRREIEILSRLSHPNIVALYDWGEFRGAPWYSMSYVEGESLGQRLKREGQLPIPDALHIARSVAAALSEAHAAHIVHRDIKPANILLRGDQVLVADFGIARAMSRAASLESISSAGLQIGTPAYMSPEQASAGSEVDGRSDIYSLGCVLYEMLAGQPPFSGSTSPQLVARHVLDPVPPLSTVRRSLPKSVEDVVYHALSKSPADRFQTADEFARALDAVAKDPSVSVVAPPRRWRGAMLGAAAAVAVIAGGWTAIAASRRARDARAVAAADTTRWAVFPFEQSPLTRAVQDGDEAVRRALLRWNGLQLVDQKVVSEAVGSGSEPPGAARARAVALGLHAGRYVIGSYSSTQDGRAMVHASLFDVGREQVPLAEVTESAVLQAASMDSAVARLSARLLFRTADSATLFDPYGGTNSLSARQAFLSGWNAVQEWNLASADSAFANATRLDAKFARASLWLALVRIWSRQAEPAWSFAAEAAAAGRDLLPPGDRGKADAVRALARGDRPGACSTWDALTRSDSIDFAAWYGAADCLQQDRMVIPDSRSASGWSFRSGHHTALLRYQRAFEINPAILRALRDDAFERVRRLLWTSGNDIRSGQSAPPKPLRFVSYPSLDHDTLAFVPLPFDRILAADPATMKMIPTSVGAALQRNRALFHDVASTWAAADHRSAEAREAVAMSLFLLGEPSALDTLMRARALATDARERQRVAETEVWMRVQFALPDDIRALHAARLLADSLLDTREGAPVDPHTLASIAALTGRAFEAATIERGVVGLTLRQSTTPVAAMSRSLLVFSAFGGPADTLRILEKRIDAVIQSAVTGDQRAAVRAEALGRAAQVAFPSVRLDAVSSLASSSMYLLSAEAASVRNDTALVMKDLENIRAGREHFSAPLTFDGLYPEAWLIAWSGDPRRAIAWLDQLLDKLRVTPSPIDPIHAASLMRAMSLRAELAAKVGDTRGARRWAAAVAELWSGADDFLQPTVARMRSLAK